MKEVYFNLVCGPLQRLIQMCLACISREFTFEMTYGISAKIMEYLWKSEMIVIYAVENMLANLGSTYKGMDKNYNL